MIFSGPAVPKFICEACVASERVGDGGPGVTAVAFWLSVSVRNERGRGIPSRI